MTSRDGRSVPLPRPGDLPVELAVLPRLGGAAVRLAGVGVEFLARETPAGGDQLGADALPDEAVRIPLAQHRPVRVAAGQDARPHRHPRHRLDPARDGDVVGAALHALRRDVQGLLGRPALPVDGHGGDAPGEPGGEDGRPGDVEAWSPTWVTTPPMTSSTSPASIPARSTSTLSVRASRSAGSSSCRTPFAFPCPAESAPPPRSPRPAPRPPPLCFPTNPASFRSPSWKTQPTTKVRYLTPAGMAKGRGVVPWPRWVGPLSGGAHAVVRLFPPCVEGPLGAARTFAVGQARLLDALDVTFTSDISPVCGYSRQIAAQGVVKPQQNARTRVRALGGGRSAALEHRAHLAGGVARFLLLGRARGLLRARRSSGRSGSVFALPSGLPGLSVTTTPRCRCTVVP